MPFAGHWIARYPDSGNERTRVLRVLRCRSDVGGVDMHRLYWQVWAGCILADKEAIVVKEPKSRCNGGKVVVCRVVSSAPCPATDLRNGADRPCLPLSRLPLSADQPAPYRDMRHLGRIILDARSGTACRLWPMRSKASSAPSWKPAIR
jgi:hypothetical protein